MVRFLAALLAVTLGSMACCGCATMSQIKALRNVNFDIESVTDVRLAGIDLDRVRAEADLSAGESARLIAAIAQRNVPLQMTLHVSAENPEENRTTARLVDMDWTLFVEDRETVSGRLTGDFVLPPGERVDVPVGMRFDLYDLANGGLADLLDLGLAIAGFEGVTKEIRLDALPTIKTPFGAMKYPGRISIRRRVGGP